MMRKILTLLITVSLAGFLLLGLSEFPPFGSSDTPAHNEVMIRYLEKSGEETGAANAVTAMILDYRGFDTYFEAAVIATALLSIIPLFPGKEDSDEHLDQP
jgi:multicomponent Na+:H+ antiporter subunit B